MKTYDAVIVGAGFTGLTAAYELTRKGYTVRVIEADNSPGGLAGTFEFSDGISLEKFYHHWFNNDVDVPELVEHLGMAGDIIKLQSRTGMYFNGRIWSLSTPWDLLRFTALPFLDRIRLGLLLFKVRRIKNWHSIENLSIREWLEPLCGKNAYKVVWEPLITSKFGVYAEQVGAVWMWKKLVLRGGTRNDKGGEELAYFKGGFGRLAEAIVAEVERSGGEISLDTRATGVIANQTDLTALMTTHGEIAGRKFIFTPAFPIIADILEGSAHSAWIKQLRRVRYLGNVCLVLRLRHRLSDTYWMNVNDPGFPFVGVIEHTNFDAPSNYGDTYIAYLSRYLPVEDSTWAYNDDQYVEFALPHLKRMFPQMERSWIIEYKIWRAQYAQPVTERGYSQFLPGRYTPYKNAFISTMAQIYPEDRGTNYAIREGRSIAAHVSHEMKQ